MCKPLPQERFCMSATTPPGSPWTPTPMPPSGCGGRRQTPSAPPLARRCNNQSEKAQARTGIPVRACLVSAFSNCKFNITEWFEIDRKFYSCGPPIVPIFHPVRSAPHSRMGQGLGQRRTAKANRSKEFSKMKKSRANHMDLHGCVMCWEKRYPFSVKYNFRYSVINLSFLGVILPVFFLRLGFQPRKPR